MSLIKKTIYVHDQGRWRRYAFAFVFTLIHFLFGMVVKLKREASDAISGTLGNATEQITERGEKKKKKKIYSSIRASM